MTSLILLLSLSSILINFFISTATLHQECSKNEKNILFIITVVPFATPNGGNIAPILFGFHLHSRLSDFVFSLPLFLLLIFIAFMALVVFFHRLRVVRITAPLAVIEIGYNGVLVATPAKNDALRHSSAARAKGALLAQRLAVQVVDAAPVAASATRAVSLTRYQAFEVLVPPSVPVVVTEIPAG